MRNYFPQKNILSFCQRKNLVSVPTFFYNDNLATRDKVNFCFYVVIYNEVTMFLPKKILNFYQISNLVAY